MSVGVDQPTDEVLALEWALWLLDPADRAVAEARRTHDPAFAALCTRRAAEAQELLDGPEVAPGPNSWPAIERRVRGEARVVGLERAVRRWRGLAAGLALGLAGVGATLALHRPPPARVMPATAPTPAPIIALLTAPAGAALLSVSIDRVTGRLVSARRDVAVGPRAAELWVIPADGVPRPLGLLTPAAQPAVDRRYLGLLRAGATLAVSLEPAGGSPTGRPTGPIIVTGAIA